MKSSRGKSKDKIQGLREDLDRARMQNGQIWYLSLDKQAGCGFMTNQRYRFSCLSMKLKLVGGDSAGENRSILILPLDLDEGFEAAESKVERNGCDVETEGSFEELNEDDFVDAKDMEESEAVDPYVGIQFESKDDAKRFYNDYAQRVGFVVRVMQHRRSEIDGRTLVRRPGCNKQGFSPNVKGKIGPGRKPRPNAREGCKATILFKMEKSGKWVVTRFVKEHNHPLVVTAHEYTMV
ncbi:protein FAR1-RELATED SEQUENCE 6-like isoform X2 [Henckelia pumila]|uniref:protein FAR1-RELATED SEQUENCE 6-like isoform X2 n=1 Tax=Henckelia pumila TaxID=405737 RepID=UPI003C6E006F